MADNTVNIWGHMKCVVENYAERTYVKLLQKENNAFILISGTEWDILKQDAAYIDQSLTSLYNYRSSLSQVTTVTVEKCNATKYVSFHKKIKTNKGFMQNKFINLKLRQWDDLYIAMPQIDELYKAKRKCTAYMRRTSRYTKKLYNQHCRVPRRKTAR